MQIVILLLMNKFSNNFIIKFDDILYIIIILG